jgi:single-stranded-DNA-specific exonuclease
LTPSDYFLDVETSALGQPWRPRLDAAGELHALAIAQIGGHDELIARVLAGRGVLPDAVDRHLAPSFRDLMPDPNSLRDMAAATERLGRAVMAHEKVAIFGDYDVDGACSAALLSEYLKACGLETIVHIPDRVTEGYGPNVEAIQGFASRGATLVVTVDCGAVSHEPFEVASRLGLDVIVFDHHQAPEVLPKTAALVDPNREDDLSGLGYLCAAGVTFMALVALNRALREAGFRNGGKGPDLPTSCRSSGSTAPLSSKGLRSCASAAVLGLPLCSTSPALTDRRGPTIWALSLARASTRADALGTRRSASGS